MTRSARSIHRESLSSRARSERSANEVAAAKCPIGSTLPVTSAGATINNPKLRFDFSRSFSSLTAVTARIDPTDAEATTS